MTEKEVYVILRCGKYLADDNFDTIDKEGFHNFTRIRIVQDGKNVYYIKFFNGEVIRAFQIH